MLVIAEACNPSWTSVPLVGYNFMSALAQRNDVQLTLATHPRNQEALAADAPTAHVEIVYPNNEYVARPMYQLGKLMRGGSTKGWTTNTAMAWLSYVAFERELYQLLKRRLAGGEFDLIHRITPVSPTVGSPLACWTDTPMLIGPLNGGLPWPADYPQLKRKEREFLVPLRMAYKKLPYYRGSYRRLSAVIAGSRHTASEIPKDYQGRRYILPENGVDPQRFALKSEWTPPRGPFRFVTIGRLVPYKGLWLTLQAMAQSARLRECELVVIGDGPDRALLERQAVELGIAGNVQFLGWLEQRQASEVLRHSQAFVFPSLREFGGGVVLEAMASGLPSIIADYGGPAELLDPGSGILLPMQGEAPMVANLRQAMEKLVDTPELCRSMAANGAQRVRNEFTWEAKAEQLVSIYRQMLGVDTCPEPLKDELVTSALTS